ncbi:MAG: heme-binding protein [Deltaproteobacteria bacterium]|nr:heme-binding protein [Deltaproteobacteria bacterium]
MGMNIEIAKRMIKAGIQQAQEMGNLCSVAVVDDRGFLVALHRMDHAPIPTVDIARDKAWTAAAFRVPSADIGRFGDPATPGFGFNTQNWNDRLTTIPGGLPVQDGDEVIGGVGVSGGTPDEDMAVCRAALAAVFASD